MNVAGIRHLTIRYVFFSAILIFSGSCARWGRPRLQSDAAPGLIAAFAKRTCPRQFKASGEVMVSLNGERFTGSVDVKRMPDETFKAAMYTTFGTRAGAVNATKDSGTVELQNVRYSFALDDTMDSLPFLWASDITFREFAGLLAGCQTEEFAIMQSDPDTVILSKAAATVLWKRKLVTITARINRRSEQINQIMLEKRTMKTPWQIVFSAFKNGNPLSIAFRESDKNYFSLVYDRVAAEN